MGRLERGLSARLALAHAAQNQSLLRQNRQRPARLAALLLHGRRAAGARRNRDRLPLRASGGSDRQPAVRGRGIEEAELRHRHRAVQLADPLARLLQGTDGQHGRSGRRPHSRLSGRTAGQLPQDECRQVRESRRRPFARLHQADQQGLARIRLRHVHMGRQQGDRRSRGDQGRGLRIPPPNGRIPRGHPVRIRHRRLLQHAGGAGRGTRALVRHSPLG